MVLDIGPWFQLELGRKDLLNVEDWAEIRRLHRAEGLSIKEIVRLTGVARNTVRSALRSDEPPCYVREAPGSIVDAVEPELHRWLKEFPRMPASVIAERIGWDRGMSVLRDRVRELRPIYLPVDPCQRTEYRPGELAQWDLWFPAVDIPVASDQTARPPVIVGVSGFSRFLVARLIPSRESCDVLGGHLACLRQLGAVPRYGVYDQEGAIGRWRGNKMVFTEAFNRFRGVLGMGGRLCARGDPEAKGLVERANRYLETSFLPGRIFESPDDFNAQLSAWLVKANSRVHAGIQARPSERVFEDRGAMMALPPVLPDVASHYSTRLGRDHYVRADTNDYSVHPKVIGRRVEVTVDLEWVTATCAGEEVARHRRSWATHRTFTAVDHGRARRDLREQARTAPPDDVQVEQRDLDVYDHITGVA
jgi:transposase